MLRYYRRKGEYLCEEYDGKQSLEGVFIPADYSPKSGDMIIKRAPPYLVPRDLFDMRFVPMGQAPVVRKGGEAA